MSDLKRLYDFEKYGSKLKEGIRPGYLNYEEENQTLGEIKDSIDDEKTDAELLDDVDVADEKADQREKEDVALDFGPTDDTSEQLLKKLDFVQGIMSQYKKYLGGENIKIDDGMKKKIDALYKAVQ